MRRNPPPSLSLSSLLCVDYFDFPTPHSRAIFISPTTASPTTTAAPTSSSHHPALQTMPPPPQPPPLPPPFTMTATSTITYTTKGMGTCARPTSLAEVGWRSTTTDPGGASGSCGEPDQARFLWRARIRFMESPGGVHAPGGPPWWRWGEGVQPTRTLHMHHRPQMSPGFESRRAPP